MSKVNQEDKLLKEYKKDRDMSLKAAQKAQAKLEEMKIRYRNVHENVTQAARELQVDTSNLDFALSADPELVKEQAEMAKALVKMQAKLHKAKQEAELALFQAKQARDRWAYLAGFEQDQKYEQTLTN